MTVYGLITILLKCWRKILNEDGLDPDAIELLVCDGSKWREMVRNRKSYLEDW